MNTTWKIGLLALLLGFVVLSAQAADAPASVNDAPDAAFAVAHEQWRTTAVATLAARNDVDALYTASLLTLSPMRSSATDNAYNEKAARQASLDLIDQAAALAPDAADIAAQALMLCNQIKACDLATYADRYRAAAPDDARAWLPALQRAIKQHDETKVTAIVQTMGAAQSFGSYLATAAERLQRGLAHVPSSPSMADMSASIGYAESLRKQLATLTRDIQASAMAAAIALPGYGSLVKACKPTTAAFAQRRSACRSIGLLLEQGGSMIDRNIGLMLHRHAADNDADRAAAIANGRRLDWQTHLYVSKLEINAPDIVHDGQPTPEQALAIMANAQSYRDAVREHHGEVAGIQALLTQAELPLEPPADWVDRQQQIRLTEDRRIAEQAQAKAAGTQTSQNGACHASD